MTRYLAPAVAIVALLSATPTRGAGTPAKCAAAKQKAAAVKVLKKVKCYGRALLHGEPVESECLAKAEAKFLATWTRIEAAGGCVTVGDADNIEALVDQFVANLLALVSVTTTTTTTTTSPTTTSTTTSPTTTSTTFPETCSSSSFPECAGTCALGLPCRPFRLKNSSGATDSCICGNVGDCTPPQLSFCNIGACPAAEVCQIDTTVNPAASCGCTPIASPSGAFVGGLTE